MKPLSIRINESVYENLRQIAVNEERSINWLVNQIILNWFEQKESKKENNNEN